MNDPSKEQSRVKMNTTDHDQRFAAMKPLRDNLHFMIRMVLADLPENARILCVGSGTGPEIIDLADYFPDWQFTAVEPSAEMLEAFNRKAEAADITDRCICHEGTLESLPESEPFNAALSLLVSHFLGSSENRIAFFRGISERLDSQGILVSADLASDIKTPTFQNLLEPWMRMHQYSGFSEKELERFRTALQTRVPILPQSELEAIYVSGGFREPTLFCQSLFIHGWFARKAA